MLASQNLDPGPVENVIRDLKKLYTELHVIFFWQHCMKHSFCLQKKQTPENKILSSSKILLKLIFFLKHSIYSGAQPRTASMLLKTSMWQNVFCRHHHLPHVSRSFKFLSLPPHPLSVLPCRAPHCSDSLCALCQINNATINFI